MTAPTNAAPGPRAADVRRARRRLSTVLVEGLEPLGLAVAEQLTTLGLGTLLLRDETPVGSSDVPAELIGPGRRRHAARYRETDQGRPRLNAALRMLAPARPDADTTLVLDAPEGAPVLGADLCVLTGTRASSTEYLSSTVNAGLPVLPVSVSAGWLRIGPLLGNTLEWTVHPAAAPDDEQVAAKGCCPECLQHHGVVVAHRESASAAVSAQLIALTASAVAHQVQILIDGACAPAVESGVLLTDAYSGTSQLMNLSAHPECSCLLRRRTPAESPGRRRAWKSSSP